MTTQKIRQIPRAKPQIYYGYVVAVITFLIMSVTWGVYIAFGVFFNPLLNEFAWTRAVISGAVSLAMLISGLLGIVVGRANDRFGPRVLLSICGALVGLGYFLMSLVSSVWQLYLFYGVIIGIGMAGFWVPLLSTTARWFVKRRSLMTGFVVAGMGTGGLIAPPIANQFIAIYDWRMAYIILGSLVLVIVVSAAQFMKRNPPQKVPVTENYTENGAPPLEPGIKSLSLKEAAHIRAFWLVTGLEFGLGFCVLAIQIHIAPQATDLGFSSAMAATILATIGGGTILGNVVVGSAGDRIGNRRAVVIVFLLMSIALFWLISAAEVWKLILFAGVFGFATGGSTAVLSPLVADLFGLKSHGLIYGVLVMGFSVGGALGPIMAGYIFDVNSSYQIAFLICAMVATIGLVLAAYIKPTGSVLV